MRKAAECQIFATVGMLHFPTQRPAGFNPVMHAPSGREGQLLRRPSAARFHCVTLSAIMRVDFIAAWLSCA